MATQILFPSNVALSADVRVKLVDSLNRSLATTSDLYSQVKQAHWNVKGPQFFARHELFDRLAARLLKWADELAERGSTLGGYAEGTLRLAARSSEIDEYDLAALDGAQHVAALVKKYAQYCAMLRRRADEAEDLGDPVTQDLYIEVLRHAEQDGWFLQSHMVQQQQHSAISESRGERNGDKPASQKRAPHSVSKTH